MAKVIALANQKGGVAKTTTCINLAASLVFLKKQVLLVDLDPQGNATMGSGIDKSKLKSSMNEVLQQTSSIHEASLKVPAGYCLLPANSDLTVAEVALLRSPNQQQNLRHAIKLVEKNFDYILIDCPPSLNMLTLNALVAADSIIIPMQCEYYALEGLSALLETVEQIKENLNKKLTIEGILRTMYDKRNKLTLDVSKQLTQHFKQQLYSSIIPRNVRLAEAPSYGLPAIIYDKQSSGAKAYLKLAKEFLRRNKSSHPTIIRNKSKAQTIKEVY